MKDGRVMIVTGASSGIGRALAERAARAGLRVLATGRRTERLDELKRVVQEATGSIETLALDLRAPGAAALIVRETLARYGRIDILVNNAGGVAVGPIGAQSDDALREQVETHIVAPLALLREALDELRRSRGQVFFVGSGVARVPVGNLGAYPPAKAAVRNMARIVRNELRPDNIAVTYVDPGAVATEFMTRVGLAGPPPFLAAQPYDVARKIFDAIDTRKPVVNAVPWQSTLLGLAELFPRATDFVLARVPQIVGGDVAAVPAAEPPHALDAKPAEPTRAEAAPAPLAPEPDNRSAFEIALEPNASRMRRLNMSSTFLASLLANPGQTLETDDVALRWAGMPNKNERALTHEVLETLAGTGYLARAGDDRYVVVRSAEAAEGAV